MSNENAILPSGYDSAILAELAAEAKAAAAKERPALGKISLKGGVMSYAGNPVPGNTLDAVVLASVYRNTFYAGRFDPKNIVNPNCFALGVDDKAMSPHENVSHPEHPTCKGCPRNDWGTDLNGGQGKACKQTRRLVLTPVAALASVDAVKSAELALLDIPVTSVKYYSSYVNVLAASLNLPPYAAVVNISLLPDPKTQIKLAFTPVRPVDNVDVLRALKARQDDALRAALTPYDETAGNDPDPAPAQPTAKARKF